jgi:hypothetical protein
VTIIAAGGCLRPRRQSQKTRGRRGSAAPSTVTSTSAEPLWAGAVIVNETAAPSLFGAEIVPVPAAIFALTFAARGLPSGARGVTTTVTCDCPSAIA